MMHRLTSLSCLICGHESDDRRIVAVSIACYREAVEGRTFATVPRCLDARACRERTEAAGEPWPLDDATPGPVAGRGSDWATSRVADDDRWG
jgi:hypothetical protein